MLHTIIKKNFYQDSITLMLLSNHLSILEGINEVSVMMGTSANKQIFLNSNLYTEELEEAGPNDICIVINSDRNEIISSIEEKMEHFLKNQKSQSAKNQLTTARTWDKALKLISDPQLAVISIPGSYALEVGKRALEENLNVFMFSDNVPIKDEVSLKEKAKEKGLLFMGPDCGTGIINNVPLAFANDVRSGEIGVVGASGTGIQEVTTIIDKLGKGVSSAIGVGGRDLSEEVGGISFLTAIAALERDEKTKVFVLISKPPAAKVRKEVMNYLRTIDKPVVTVFLGEKPVSHEQGLYHAYTLEEAARIAVSLRV